MPYCYHKTRLLVEFGVGQVILGARVGDQPLVLAYFGLDRQIFTHHVPTRAQFASKYYHNASPMV